MSYSLLPFGGPKSDTRATLKDSNAMSGQVKPETKIKTTGVLMSQRFSMAVCKEIMVHATSSKTFLSLF